MGPQRLSGLRFQSFCTKPQVAAINAVEAPTNVITNNAVELYSNIGEDLTSKYNPAVTRVAAWIRADTGVGFCIQSKILTDWTISYINYFFNFAGGA